MTNRITFFSLLALMTAFIGCSSTSTVQEENARQQMAEGVPVQQVDSTYEIQAGDEIELLVWEQESFNTTTTVSNTGTITVPLVGDVQASGLTKDELERDLVDHLSEYIRGDIQLTVSVRSTDQLMVSVLGSVTRADNYPITTETSIFKVLSMAGGPGENADIRNVKIYREGSNQTYQDIDLTHFLESGTMSRAAMVHPGDVVYVPPKNNAVREMSDFLRDVVLLFGIFRVVN